MVFGILRTKVTHFGKRIAKAYSTGLQRNKKIIRGENGYDGAKEEVFSTGAFLHAFLPGDTGEER